MNGRVQTVRAQRKRWKRVGKRTSGHEPAWNADVCGRYGCKGQVGNWKGWKWVGRRSGGHERAWICKRVRMVWVPGKGWKWVGRRTGGHERAWITDVCKRNGCKGKGWKRVEGTDARTCADGAGAREMLNGWEKDRWASASVGAQTCADDVGARERLEMGWEKGRWA